MAHWKCGAIRCSALDGSAAADYEGGRAVDRVADGGAIEPVVHLWLPHEKRAQRRKHEQSVVPRPFVGLCVSRIVGDLNEMPANVVDALLFGAVAVLEVGSVGSLPSRTLIFILNLLPLFESKSDARNRTLPPGRSTSVERVSCISHPRPDPLRVPDFAPLVEAGGDEQGSFPARGPPSEPECSECFQTLGGGIWAPFPL